MLQIDDHLHQNQKGQTVVSFEIADQNTKKKIYELITIQNKIAQQKNNRKHILEIENKYQPENEKKIYVIFKNKNYFNFNKVRGLDEIQKYELFNQACILLFILNENQKQPLPQLTNKNFFFKEESLMVSFLSVTKTEDSQETNQIVIAKLMKEIINHTSCLLPIQILKFYLQEIKQLINNRQINITHFLSEYSYIYETFFQQSYNMPCLPYQLQALTSDIKKIVLRNPPSLENKMIFLKEFQDHIELFRNQLQQKSSNLNSIDKNYFYYFNLEFLQLLENKYDELEVILNEDERSKIKKIKKFIELQMKVDQIKKGQDFQIQNLFGLNPTKQYYILKLMEEYYNQKIDKSQINNFRSQYEFIIKKLNQIDALQFKFNKISNIFIDYFREINSELQWIQLEANNPINSYVKYLMLSNRNEQTFVLDLDERKEVYKYPCFKVSYWIDANQLKIGYAIDKAGNYYKGAFKNGNLIFGDILQLIENNIINYYRNVSYFCQQQKVCIQNCNCGQICISGQNCIIKTQQIFHDRIEPISLKSYRGDLQKGQYFGEGVLTGNQLKYEGNFRDGVFDGYGTLTVHNHEPIRYEFYRYEGNFHQGKMDDEKGKFYHQRHSSQYSVRSTRKNLEKIII